jgi:hypothetical protein
MIAKARGNILKTELRNAEFRLGEIEHLPVADASVDVIMSNCVINLSTDKPAVFREALPRPRTGRPRGDLRHRGAQGDSRHRSERSRGVCGLCLGRSACARD